MKSSTPQNPEHKKQRTAMLSMCNRVKLQFAIGRVKTWADMYKLLGMAESAYPSNHANPLTFPELKSYLADMTQALEDRLTGATVKPVEEKPAIGCVPTARAAAPVSTIVAPPVAKKEEPLQVLGESENYGLKPSPNERTFYYWFQKKAISELFHGITVENKRGMLLLASTGLGKTFIAGGLVRRLVDMKFADKHTFGATLYLYVTKATIVEQTKRVFAKYFNLSIKDGVEIINIEQLRSKAGAQWVKEKLEIINGQETFIWEWRQRLNPVVILWDESQGLKNEGSIQHRIGVSFNDIKSPIFQVFISATPFTRVCEAKCFAVSTHKDISNILGTVHTSHLSNDTWPTYASFISGSQSRPDEYNEAAVERLVKDLESYIARVKGVRPQFQAENRVEMINFQSEEAAAYYAAAWERYLKEKAKAEEEAAKTGQKVSGIARLTMFLKFRMAAEHCRCDILGERMWETVNLDGKAAVAALGFKGSIIGIVKYLIEKKGVSRDQISLVWGGGKTNVTKKEKAALDVAKQAEKLMAAGISQDEIFKMLDIEPEDLIRAEEKMAEELPEEYRLGPQSAEERQREIDKFQSGKTLYCLFTMRAGGVGLSLHHSDEFSPVKCRRKESGYAYEEDIDSVPIRPRRNFVSPTYSAIELVQSLGRCPRLTSLSTTEQILLFYRGTIEVDVAAITNTKLRCLGKVVKQREDWMDVADTNGASASKHLQELAPDDPDELTDGEDDE